MQRIAFCTRCRGMRTGWNGRYMLHLLVCTAWASRSKLLIAAALIIILGFALPTPSAIIFSGLNKAEDSFLLRAGLSLNDPAVEAVDAFLEKHDINGPRRTRVASAIVASSRKYNIDPQLVASVMIVESRANPFAISARDSVGIMQIHLRTWGPTVDKEGINLFKIEDNVDLGVRILKNYIQQSGVWEGVKRYRGWNADSPESTQNVQKYLRRVRSLYTSKVR